MIPYKSSKSTISIFILKVAVMKSPAGLVVTGYTPCIGLSLLSDARRVMKNNSRATSRAGT
jgi:hypothetical protein